MVSYFSMVAPEGLEPSTHGLKGRCSTKLSYGTIMVCESLTPATNLAASAILK